MKGHLFIIFSTFNTKELVTLYIDVCTVVWQYRVNATGVVLYKHTLCLIALRLKVCVL